MPSGDRIFPHRHGIGDARLGAFRFRTETISRGAAVVRLSARARLIYVRPMLAHPALHDEPGDLADLVACPDCDTLHRLSSVPDGSRARCIRCHRMLVTPRAHAMTRIVVLSITAIVLMVTAISFPFLGLEAKGLSQHSSVLDTILAFSDGLFLPLALAVALLIVVLPMTRLVAIIYALGPMAFRFRPLAGAAMAFRIAQSLKPWAMAEVFVVGTAVALVKIGGLATLTIGPAFYAFVALVVVTVALDQIMSTLIVWKTLETRGSR